MIHIYNNIDSAKIKLYDMIKLEEDRQRPYFVDNDFFNNKYNISTKLKYFSIREREVTEWKQYSEEKSCNEESNKILYLHNYKRYY